MSRHREHNVLVVRKSRLTGSPVWMWYGTSKLAANKAYCCARKSEIRRVRTWAKTEEQVRRRILSIASECLADIPVTTALTRQQSDAVRRLRAIAAEAIPCDRAFYEHILAENRFRRESAKIREQMRARGDL